MRTPRRVLPPVYFLGALVTLVGLHFLLPIARVVHPPFSYGGVILIAGAIAPVVWAARLFGRSSTTIKPFEESSSLITQGPYRYTRNPMYLGMVCVLVGTCLILGTISPFFVIPVFIALIQRRFIRAEEAALTRTFGAQYTDYQRRVRRWL